MDKIVFRPKDVRGGGNIISPSKTLSDFDVSDSIVFTGSDTIDGKTKNIYNLGYRSGSYFTINSNKWITPSDNSFNISVTLRKSENQSGVGSSNVSCLVNNATSLTATTDSNGVATFTIPMVSSVCEYYLEFKYNGTSSIGGCTRKFKVYTGSDDFDIDLLVTKPLIQSGETDSLVATITGENCNEETVGVQGKTVYFFEEYTPSIRVNSDKPILESGEEATISAQLVDSENGSLVRESGVTIYFFEEYTPNIRVRADDTIIQAEDPTNISAQLFDSADGSLVKESGRTIYFYEEENVILTIDKTELSYKESETATLTATVTGANNKRFRDKTVTFKKGSTTLGTATTNSEGVATYTYSAESDGEKSFTAVCDNITSNTVSVNNYLFIDRGLTDKSSLYASASNATLTYDSTNQYYKLKTTSNNTNNLFELSNVNFPRNAIISLDFKFDDTGWDVSKEIRTGFKYGSFITKAYYANYKGIAILDSSFSQKTDVNQSLTSDKWYTLELELGGYNPNVVDATLRIKDGTTVLNSCYSFAEVSSSSTGKFAYYVGYSNNLGVCIKNLKIKSN